MRRGWLREFYAKVAESGGVKYFDRRSLRGVSIAPALCMWAVVNQISSSTLTQIGDDCMVTLAEARKIIAAAEKKAAKIGQPMNIAVADAGGNLVAHVRMDGAWIGSVDISIKKAWTSRAFDIATKDLAEHSQSGNQFFGIHASN